MRRVFQFAGFEVFPKTPPDAVEAFIEFQALGAGDCLDLGQDGLSQIVFDQQAAVLCCGLGHTHHVAHALASTPNLRLAAFRQSELASFPDGPDIGDALGASVELRYVVKPFKALGRTEMVDDAPMGGEQSGLGNNDIHAAHWVAACGHNLGHDDAPSAMAETSDAAVSSASASVLK